MTSVANDIVMNMDDSNALNTEFASVEDEREDRKRKLVAACRLFGNLASMKASLGTLPCETQNTAISSG